MLESSVSRFSETFCTLHAAAVMDADRGRSSGRGFGRGRGRGRGGASAGATDAAPPSAPAAASVPPAPAQPALAPAVSSDEHCLVCAESLRDRCILPCGHAHVCVMCTARLRTLAHNERCLLCAAVCEHAVAISHAAYLSMASTRDDGRPPTYDDFGIYGDVCGPSLTLDDSSRIFFHTSVAGQRTKLVALRQLRCDAPLRKGGRSGGVDGALTAAGAGTVNPYADGSGAAGGVACGATFATLAELQAHAKGSHSVAVCDLCAANRAVFISELPRLTPAQLKAHCDKGDEGTGFTGHPLCAFCDTRFYSDSELFSHLMREHFHCHVCAKRDPSRRHDYFNTYADLDRHFRRKHFACEDADCVAKRFVVFDSALALKAHASAEHGAVGEDLTAHVMFKFRPVENAGRGRGRGGRGGGRSGHSEAADAAAASSDDSDGGEGREGSSAAPRRIHLSADAFPSLRQSGATGPGAAGEEPAEQMSADTLIGDVTVGGERLTGGMRAQTGGGFARAVTHAGSVRADFSEDFPTLERSAGAATGPSSGTRYMSGLSFGTAARRGARFNAYTSVSALLEWSGQGHLNTRAPPPRTVVPLAGFPARAVGDVPVPAPRPQPRGFAAAVGSHHMRPTAPPPAPAPAPTPTPAAAPSNASFIASAAAALAHVKNGMDDFKAASTAARDGSMTPEAYHAAAAALFSKADATVPSSGAGAPRPLDVFKRGFPILIRALPDSHAGLRSTLGRVHDAWCASERNSASWERVGGERDSTPARATPAPSAAAAMLAAALAGKSGTSTAAASAPRPAVLPPAAAPAAVVAPTSWPTLAPEGSRAPRTTALAGKKGYSSAVHDASHAKSGRGGGVSATALFGAEAFSSNVSARATAPRTLGGPSYASRAVTETSPDEDVEVGKPAPAFTDAFSQALHASSRGVVLSSTGAARVYEAVPSRGGKRGGGDDDGATDGVMRIRVDKNKVRTEEPTPEAPRAPSSVASTHTPVIDAEAVARADAKRAAKKAKRAAARGDEDDTPPAAQDESDVVRASFADGGYDVRGRPVPRPVKIAPPTTADVRPEAFPTLHASAPAPSRARGPTAAQLMLAAALGVSEAELTASSQPNSGARDEATAANHARARARAAAKAGVQAAPAYRPASDLDAMLSGFLKSDAPAGNGDAVGDADGVTWVTGGQRRMDAPVRASATAAVTRSGGVTKPGRADDDDLAAMMSGIKVKAKPGIEESWEIY